MIFDPTLTFDCHISVLTASCISKLPQTNRSKHAFNLDFLAILINALVFVNYFTARRSGLTLLTGIYVNCNTHRTLLPG